MAFRFGLLLGAVIGYVFGAKAGRQRYEQIVGLTQAVNRSEIVQQLSEEMRRAVSQAAGLLETEAGKSFTRFTERVNVPLRRPSANGPPRFSAR